MKQWARRGAIEEHSQKDDADENADPGDGPAVLPAQLSTRRTGRPLGRSVLRLERASSGSLGGIPLGVISLATGLAHVR